ncbi:hypothetical protein ACFX2A_006684 [Malus domestica]
MFASLPCHEAQRLTHRDFPIIQQWYCSFTLSSIFEKVIMLGVWLSRFRGWCLFDFGASNLVGSVFSNVSKGWACLLFFYPSWSERCSGSCKLHVSQLCQRTLAKLSVVPMSYCCVWEVGD